MTNAPHTFRKTHSMSHHLERGDGELELSVTYTITPILSATYWQPVEGGEVELLSVTHCGAEIDLTDTEEAELIEAARQSHDDEPYGRADYLYECRRDGRMEREMAA